MIEINHVCEDEDCINIGQRTFPGCKCHKTREQMLEAEVIRLRARLAGDAQAPLDPDDKSLFNIADWLEQHLLIGSAKIVREVAIALRSPAQAVVTPEEAREMSALADEYAKGLQKLIDCGYEEYGPSVQHKHRLTIRALRFTASSVSSTHASCVPQEPEDDCYCGGGALSGHAGGCPENAASAPQADVRAALEPVAWQKRNANNDWANIEDYSDESLYRLDQAGWETRPLYASPPSVALEALPDKLGEPERSSPEAMLCDVLYSVGLHGIKQRAVIDGITSAGLKLVHRPPQDTTGPEKANG